MTPQVTIYLTPQQFEAVAALDFVQRGASFSITQAELLGGGEFAGHIMVGESMGTRPIHLDRQGQVVRPKGDPAAAAIHRRQAEAHHQAAERLRKLGLTQSEADARAAAKHEDETAELLEGRS